MPKATPTQCHNVLAVIAPTNTGIGQGHNTYVLSGTYASGTFVIAEDNLAGSSIIGVSDLTTLAPAAKGDIWFDGGATNGVSTTKANISVKNISFKNSSSATGVFLANNGGTLFLNNIYTLNTGRIFYSSGTGSITTTNSRYSGNTDTTRNAIRIAGTGGLTSSNNIYESSNINLLSIGTSGADFDSSGTSTMTNDEISGAYWHTFYQTAGTLNLINNIIAVPIGLAINGYAIKRTGGSGTVSNNIIVGSADYAASGLTLDSTNEVSVSPKWTNHGRSAIVSITVDDYLDSIDGANGFEPLFAAKGIKGTFYVSTTQQYNNPEKLARLKAIRDRGTFVLGLHGRTHSNQSLTGTIWNITGGTVTINRTTDTITWSGGGSITPFKSITLAAIKTALMGLGATVTPTAIYGDATTQAGTILLGESLADGTTATVVNLKTDDLTGATGFYYDEITSLYNWLHDNLGSYPIASATPGGLVSAQLETVLQNIGLSNSRNGGIPYEYGLSSLDMYHLNTFSTPSWFTPSIMDNENTVKKRVRAFAEWALQSGAYAQILVHDTTESTIEQMGWIIDTLKEYPEITLLDANTALNYIRDPSFSTAFSNSSCTANATPHYCCTGAGTGTCTGKVFNHIFTDQFNYTLLSASPAIDSGISVGLTTDYASNKIYGLPDIGGYEYQPPHTIGTNNINITAGARIYGDGKFRDHRPDHLHISRRMFGFRILLFQLW